MIGADGLQIHLNVMQELLMPEGDRNFSGYLENIHRIMTSVGVPVVVKEVGFGMTAETVSRLAEAGVKLIDVGGGGGTNFARIENMRSDQPLTVFEEWGLSTVESLLEAGQISGISRMATGGIRHGLDAAKAMALGAEAVGMAGAMLRLVQSRTLDECLAVIDGWHHELRVAMTALGVREPNELGKLPVLVTGACAEFARLRGISPERLARR
jgi:isopentenyl-diphosphate delta-isomerase